MSNIGEIIHERERGIRKKNPAHTNVFTTFTTDTMKKSEKVSINVIQYFSAITVTNPMTKTREIIYICMHCINTFSA